MTKANALQEFCSYVAEFISDEHSNSALMNALREDAKQNPGIQQLLDQIGGVDDYAFKVTVSLGGAEATV